MVDRTIRFTDWDETTVTITRPPAPAPEQKPVPVLKQKPAPVTK